MTFKELLIEKNITGYCLAKHTNIPYTTINDLINGKTIVQNITFKHALAISDFLKIDIRELSKIETFVPIEFRYFRNNLLNDLRRIGELEFINSIIKNKEIDFYYKNKAYKYAYYLLALIDYLCRISNKPKYTNRYNDLRKEKLEKPYFAGSELIVFESIEEAKKELSIEIIPEFAMFNIIEENVFNVA